MSGECDECGEHTLECICSDKPKLTLAETDMSEEIQFKLAPIIASYLKRPLIDALEWTLKVVANDEKHNLNVYINSWNNARKPKSPFIERTSDTRRYVCPHCLRTFLSNEYTEDWFCWECGQGLEVVPKNGKIYGM